MKNRKKEIIKMDQIAEIIKENKQQKNNKKTNEHGKKKSDF